MPKYARINKDLNIKLSKQVREYLTPDYIYIPYDNGDTLIVKSNETIYKNNAIITTSKGKSIYSPVSGKVVGLLDNIVDGKKKKTVVIENDFKESLEKSSGVAKNPFNISKEDLSKKLIEYDAFNGNLDGNTMVVSGIDLEPFEETFSYLIREHTDKLLEIIDALVNILGIHKCFLAISEDDSNNVISLLNQIGT